MILGVLSPIKYHHTPSVVTSIGIVVWKTITKISYVVLCLSFMEMSSKHMLYVPKRFLFNITMIWHLYHGIHIEVRQFKVPEHVLGV